MFASQALDYAEAVKDAHVNEEQEDLREALFLLDQRRRESRIASFRSAMDHGVSISELSRIGDSPGKWHLDTPKRPVEKPRSNRGCMQLRLTLSSQQVPVAVSVETGSAALLRTRRLAHLRYRPLICHARFAVQDRCSLLSSETPACAATHSF